MLNDTCHIHSHMDIRSHSHSHMDGKDSRRNRSRDSSCRHQDKIRGKSLQLTANPMVESRKLINLPISVC